MKITRLKSLLSIIAAVAIAATVQSSIALADHGTAAVGDAIDGDGFGVYSGSYVQSGSDHPWYTFDAWAGETVLIDLETEFPNGSYLWLYEVVDDALQVGDSTGGGEIIKVAQSSNCDIGDGCPFSDQSILYAIPSMGQYAVQVDAWLNFSGEHKYKLSISKVSEPAALAIFGL